MNLDPTRGQAATVPEHLPDVAGPLADLGCGRGALAHALAAAGREVLAVDPQARVLRGLADEPGRVRPVAAGGEALPLADGCLAAAVYANALHHVPAARQADALNEVARVLAPGGRLIVIEPLPEGPLFEVVRLVDDETAVRRAANAALDVAAQRTPPWRPVRDTVFTAPMTQPSFDAFREHLAAVDPARGPRIDARADALRAAFARTARPGPDGFVLDQPSRLTVLARVG